MQPVAAQGDGLIYIDYPTEKDGRWIEILLVVLAPVTTKHSSRMFVLMEDFTIDGPDDTVVKTI